MGYFSRSRNPFGLLFILIDLLFVYIYIFADETNKLIDIDIDIHLETSIVNFFNQLHGKFYVEYFK